MIRSPCDYECAAANHCPGWVECAGCGKDMCACNATYDEDEDGWFCDSCLEELEERRREEEEEEWEDEENA